MTSRNDGSRLLRAETFSVLRTSPALPVPTALAREIIALTRADGVTPAQIEHALRADPELAAQLEKVVNAGRPGNRPPVTLREALQILGLTSLRGIALGFSMLASHRKGKCLQFDYPAFWLRALSTAVAMQAINEVTKVAAPDEMFTVGLLADLGKLMLAAVFPERYGHILAAAAATPHIDRRAEERQEFGLVSEELSAELFLQWGVPEFYASAVVVQEVPEKVAQGDRTALFVNSLWLARAMAAILVQPAELERDLASSVYRVAARLSIDNEGLLALGQVIAERTQSWGETFGLGKLPTPRFAEAFEQHLASPGGGVLEGKGEPLNVLVVDDDSSLRQFLIRLLEDSGHHVYEAENGSEGLRMAMELVPDILVTDWIMPDIDGLELIRRLRSQPVGERIYVLVATAKTSDEDLVEAFDAGADDYIPKPLREKTFMARFKAGQRIASLQKESERQFREMKEVTSELSESNRMLQRAAVTDGLTGCPNRRYALEALEQEWLTAQALNGALSCLAIDVDGFRDINDRLGHVQGDQVFIAIARALKERLGGRDLLCRLGGDEFLVICPGATPLLAGNLARAMGQAVAALPHQAGDGPCSVSIGVAGRQAGMAGPGDLLDAADRALRQAKAAGRGTVSVAAAG